ncbi:MAG: glycoside hydrolase [Oscillospiraceae bacterium]|jgi:hypothetical protein|nr:glycoside hydrolase [Oscillospiraceae bacterium]
MKTTIRMIHSDSLSCEPIVRRMPDGSLLCVSQVGDVTEPAPGNRVKTFRSMDDGDTWKTPQPVYPETGEAVYVTEMNVVDGVVRVYLEVHSGRFLNMRCVVMESRDSGHTWTDAGSPPFFPAFTFFRGLLQLRDGARLLPYQHMPVSPEENARLVIANHNIADFRQQKAVWDADVYAIQNGVIRWDAGCDTPTLCKGPDTPVKGRSGRSWNWSEPTLAELPNDGVAMLLRVNGSGCLWRSDSHDGGRAWEEATPTNIPNPGNKPKLLNLPDGRIALLHTPDPKRRYPIALWLSDDGMKTWGDKRVVSDFPNRYDYPDGFSEGGDIRFTIEINRHEILFFRLEGV